MELNAYREYVDRDLSIRYYRTKQGQEVDFVLTRGRYTVAVESKITRSVDRSDLKGLRALAEDHGLDRALVVCQEERKRVSRKQGLEPDVEIFSLSGQPVRLIEAVDGVHAWDGTDQAGNTVPPGAYIVRLRLSADAGDEVIHRIINVAY